VEGNEEHGMFFNLTEIFHNQDTFIRFAISYRSGRIIEMWKEKKNRNVKDYFILEYISEIFST
jgi:hypothetical protein